MINLNDNKAEKAFSTAPGFKDKWYVMVLRLENVKYWSDRIKTSMKLLPHCFARINDVILSILS